MLPEVPLDGKPPKSIGEMRHVLKAIMNSNPERPRGPYVDGLPPQERKAVILAAEDQRFLRSLFRGSAQQDRASQEADSKRSIVGLDTTRPPVTFLTQQQAEELLQRSRWCGALCGFLLGSQLAFALAIIIMIETSILLAPAACVPLGILLGDYSARCYLRRHWPEYYWLNR